MIFNFKKDWDVQRFNIKVDIDKELGKRVRYERISQKRSLKINAYLHVLIGYFASEYGETKEYVKAEIYKKQSNLEMFAIEFENKKQGYKRAELRSSADLTDAEMALSIERFKIYSLKEAGILLPNSDQKEFLEHCLQEIENNKYYI